MQKCFKNTFVSINTIAILFKRVLATYQDILVYTILTLNLKAKKNSLNTEAI